MKTKFLKKVIPLLLFSSVSTLTSCTDIANNVINGYASVLISASNGSITLLNEGIDSNKIEVGTIINFSVTPFKGYELEKVTLNDVDITNQNSFEVMEATVYVLEATFKKSNEEVPIEYASVKISEDITNGEITITNINDLSKISLNSEVIVDATPNDGYKLNTLDVNGIDILENKSFIVTEPIEFIIHASFIKIEDETKYGTIRINQNITNGQVKFKDYSNNSLVPLGTLVTLEIIPNENYELTSLTVNGENILNSKSFSVNEEKIYEVDATFRSALPIIKYGTIKINENITNGEISFKDHSNNEEVELGTEIEVIVKEDSGYQLEKLTVNSLDITSSKKFIVNEEITYEVNATFIKEGSEETSKNINFEYIGNYNDGAEANVKVSDFKIDEDLIGSVYSIALFGGNGLRFSSGSRDGELTIKLTKKIKISKITINSTNYNNDTGELTITLNNEKVTKSLTNGENTFEFNNIETDTINFKGKEKARFYLHNFIVSTSGKEEVIDPIEATTNLKINGDGEVKLSKTSGFSGDIVQIYTFPGENNYVSEVKANDEILRSISLNIYEFTLEPYENIIEVTFKDYGEQVDTNYDYLYGNKNIFPSRGNYGDYDSYYEPVRGLKGEALKDALHDLIDDHKEYSYDSVGDILLNTDADPFNSNNIIFTYEGSLGNGNGYNKEHTWAKSHGNFGTSKGAGSDIHNLRPCHNNLNSTRNNFDFGEVEAHNSSTSIISKYDWARKTMEGDYIGDNQYGERVFEPKDEFKGDVARIIFYMAVRYDGNGEVDLEVEGHIDTNRYYNFTSGTEGLHGNFEDLYKWATTSIDPVSDFEVSRNNIIDEKYQHNRNPFIDHPEFLIMIYDKTYNGPGALND